MFHSQIFLDEVHSGQLAVILVRVIVVAVQAVHNVAFEMIEQIHLFRKFLGDVFRVVVLANIYSAVSSRSNVIKVATTLSGKARAH